jgi:N-acylglucosamine-6-phosphate 2-epimerase
VLADVSTVDEGVAAAEASADAVASSLSGYTENSRALAGPDLELVAELAQKLTVPVLAEGRIRSPEQARAALDTGAWAVVVDSAITAPAWLAGQVIVL